VTLALAASSALAETAYEDAGLAAPCLAAQTEVAGFRAAFEAAGWTEALGAARTPALWTLGELRYVVTRLPSLKTQDDYESFIEGAHKVADRDRDWDLVMTRDGISVGIFLYGLNSEAQGVGCYLSGPDVPGVAAAMLQPTARAPDPDRAMSGAIGSYFESPDLPGYDKLRYDWIVIAPPFTPDPPLLGAQAIIVTYDFSKANPPEPPQADPIEPSGSGSAGRNVRKHR
jgi:hypothetical protein